MQGIRHLIAFRQSPDPLPRATYGSRHHETWFSAQERTQRKRRRRYPCRTSGPPHGSVHVVCRYRLVVSRWVRCDKGTHLQLPPFFPIAGCVRGDEPNRESRGEPGAAHVLLAAGFNCTRTHARTHMKVSGFPVRDCAPAVGSSCAPDSVCFLSFVGRTAADDHHSGISIGPVTDGIRARCSKDPTSTIQSGL